MDPNHGPDRNEAFPSVLRRPGSATPPPRAAHPPACFPDLNLDQVVAAVTKGREGHGLSSYFHAPLCDPADVVYRQEVFRDLADAGLRHEVLAFSRSMQRVRERSRRADAIRNPLQAQRLGLDGASTYCAAVSDLARALERRALASRALRDVAAYLRDHVRSPAFTALHDDVERLERRLETVTYRLTILEDRVRVRPASRQHDYGEAVERTFRKFRRRAAPQAVAEPGDRIDMNHVEAIILDMVARLHPQVFGELEAFAARHGAYADPVVELLDREMQFYLAYLEHAQRFEGMGLRFCLPEVSASDKEVFAHEAFDLALAGKLLQDEGTVVPNDFRLDGPERILVVTGANQGGKTTFARMFGQLHYLAALGCPVPGRAARTFLFDEILTHFEREEDLRTLQGKLQEELMRLRTLLDRTSPRSIVIMNEAFSSTATVDALELGRETLERLLEVDAIGIYVTFVDELSSLEARIASVTATVDPVEPSRRTFRIVRRPADGHAYALAIARSYGLTYDELRLRLRP
jgi:DNA mismatch repair protein MutS